MSDSPFSSFLVSPTFGATSAALSYTLKAGLSGDVYFYRSANGQKGWEILNPGSPVTATSGDFIDTGLPGARLLDDYHWRGMLEEAGGDRSGGEPVKAFEDLSRSEYGTVRKMILDEWRGMRRGQTGSGTKVFYCIPKEFGTSSAHVDEETGQRLGPECAADADDSLGEAYQGGYHSPTKTWVKIIGMGDMVEKQRDGAEGTSEEAGLLLRLLAHPRPRRGHLIVFPQTDERYVIGDAVKRFFFRGIHPISWHVQAGLLDRSDPRYRLVMPDWDA